VSHAFGGAAHHWPDTDLITMGWLGFAALGVLLPSIDSIELPGGGGVKFAEAVAAGEEGIAGLEHALGEATELVAEWLGTVGWFNTYLQRRDVDDDAALRSVFRYCLERMEDAKQWMGDAGEPIRISLWWQDQIDGDLFFMFSNDIRDERTKSFRFSPNSGLMGQAFAENRIYNLGRRRRSTFRYGTHISITTGCCWFRCASSTSRLECFRWIASDGRRSVATPRTSRAA
jgi:hypothetical protein